MSGKREQVKQMFRKKKTSLNHSMEGSTSESNRQLKEFWIPDYILNQDSEPENCPYETPDCPVIVFVNSKSGGQLGGSLLQTYRSLLNNYQVVDLLEQAPDEFLSSLYLNLENLKQKEDDLAIYIQEKLRLVVAGGDGTAGWLLGVLCDLKLSHPPPIATMPLGTGNNLPFAFGWGKRNPGTDEQSVKSFLYKVMEARVMKIDNWHILMRMKIPTEGNCDPIAPLELPHSLHAFHRVSSTDSSNLEGHLTFRGGFWNYFSMGMYSAEELNGDALNIHPSPIKLLNIMPGMDAQVSYAFHSERKRNPEKFKNQLVNQSEYAKLGCTQGWFFASLSHPADKNIAQLAKVQIMKKHGDQWEELHIPSSIRSIICLNLPSFSGGLNPWGKPNKNRSRHGDFTHPYVDDGLIEVVGFRNAWQGLALLAPNGHGTRLAQAKRIRFEFHKGAADHTYMRIDGEPWKQPLPIDDDAVVVEISHHGQVNMLATHDCCAKSIRDPSSVHYSGNEEDDNEDDSVTTEGEEWSKFGAASTFKIPDEVDISQLS